MQTCYNLRSNLGILLQPTKGKMLEKLGKRAFQAAAPHLWNELPLQLQNINSLEILRTQPGHSFLDSFFEK